MRQWLGVSVGTAALVGAGLVGGAVAAEAQRPLGIAIESTPPGATVHVDSADTDALGTTPLAKAMVQKGAHVFLFTLEGHEPAEVRFEVTKAGERVTATLVPLAELSVSSTDASALGAQIRVDGEALGTVPSRSHVRAGRHLVQVGREGYLVFSRWVDLKAGELAEVPVTLAPAPPAAGSILIAGDVPGAAVYVDGEPHGVTPTVLDDVRPGEHVVEVRAGGFPPHVAKVTVAPKARVTVSPTFRASASAGASLRVIANIPDAVITIDGESIGRAPVTKAGLRPGEHLVGAQAPGFAPVDARVTLADEEVRVVSLTLEPMLAKDGRIVVKAAVPGATVSVDGEAKGAPPVVMEQATPGAHAIVVTAPGHTDYTTTCETGPGQNCEVDAVLEPKGVRVRVVANARDATFHVDGDEQGPVPWEGVLSPGPHRIEVRASGFLTHAEQVDLLPAAEPRVFDVKLEDEAKLSPEDKRRRDAAFEAAARAATPHAARPLAERVAAIDLSAGWPHLLEGRVGIGVAKNLDAGVAFRSFFRLTEVELRAKYGLDVSSQVSVAGQVKVGGGIGPSEDPLPAEPPGAGDHPVNAFFVGLEGLGTLHFSEHGAFTGWVGVDFHSDRYDWTGSDSDVLSNRGVAGDRQDVARLRLGGALELVLDRHWNAWGQFEGILAGSPRDLLGDVLDFGSDDTLLYFRLGLTYKF